MVSLKRIEVRSQKTEDSPEVVGMGVLIFGLLRHDSLESWEDWAVCVVSGFGGHEEKPFLMIIDPIRV